MKTLKHVLIGAAVAVPLLLTASVYGTGKSVFNGFQRNSLVVQEANAEVLNQYQRRADLIPNLVRVVEKAAANENKILKDVIEARSKLGSVQLTPEALKDPEAMKNFSRVQGDITNALSKMMMLTEKYPELQTNKNFLDLQAQLEGTENRITVARNRAIKAVTVANSTIVEFPANIYANVLGLQKLPQFTVDDVKAISTAPKIE